MALRVKESRTEIINKIIALVVKKLPQKQAQFLTLFVPQYYALVSEEDLNERNILDLYGAVVSHWNFIYQRKQSEAKVRVFNPQYEQHGWQSKHTIVEISHPDMPFLVDSVRMELTRHNVTIHQMIHPNGINLRRDAEGKVIEVLPPEHMYDAEYGEAPIYAEIDHQTDAAVLAGLEQDLLRVLADVRLVVADWKKMHTQAEHAANRLSEHPPRGVDELEIKETIDFIRWIANDRFTFLGYREYALTGEKGQEVLQIVPGSGLGLLKDERTHHAVRNVADMPPEARKMAFSSHILIITKTKSRSTVHRPVYADYIGIKCFNAAGEVVGEHVFIGLYTSVAYHSGPETIPFLRRKVATLLERSALPLNGHDGKELISILKNYPRDELFQTTDEELFRIAMGILYLRERARIRLFVREDTYGRFFSCLVYVPKKRYNSDLQDKMGAILLKAFHGNSIDAATTFTESILMRIHFIIRLAEDTPLPIYDVDEIEKDLVDASRLWIDDLRDALLEHYGEEKGNTLFAKYASAFPLGYQADFDARTAVYDIEHMESLRDDRALGMSFYRPLEEYNGKLHFKLFSRQHTISLSEVLPMLENMDFRVIAERSHEIRLIDGTAIWINDFGMQQVHGEKVDVDAVRGIFQDAFEKIWLREVEDDGFNKLVLLAGLTWRKIIIVRAYARYFRQIGFTFSQAYIEATMAKYADITRMLVELFEALFDPNQQVDAVARTEALKANILSALDNVASLDEDRILRRYLELILATLRTNYFQTLTNGQPKNYISFKLDPTAISDMPLPLPKFEIWVYSRPVEGIHLRGGKVARGGIRWSDRREDFRTEVLGLMKAQNVKNVVIVPVGAKGGFFPQLPANGTREEIMQAGVAGYSIFIQGLLDITDNLQGTKTLPPTHCVCRDEPDPYLVVAADKGTATFSDIANGISKKYHFWLGDAFASGGSAGYDHKKMGITARGAWESVKRHFRGLDINVDTTDFTVIGIGDMSGDVFGNGMLLSRHIKLVAAFDHTYIFLDPDPSPEQTFEERKRLFNLPRSSWADYNPKLISKGGGVFKRSAKFVKLSLAARRLLGIKKDTLMPNELIQAILKAPVDLLWNGGIGTYVKSSQETHSDVGDKTNDAVRINGKQLRVKVVAEGGNLGFTQLGRVEYSLNGGICYTDFIDNSAGVDCSDHEVNIKILLDRVVENGDMTEKQRNTLLEEMTEDVARSVLRHNYRQTRAVEWAASRAASSVDEYMRFINELARSGHLNREIEFLPSDEEMLARKVAGKGLTRPELAVVLAYGKISLKNALLASDVADDPYLSKEVASAFPAQLAKRFGDAMQQHRLRREIIATQLSSAIVDDMGATFVKRLYDETGASPDAVARSFVASREAFDVKGFWTAIDALDNIVKTEIQAKMITHVVRLVRRTTRWFLRNQRMRLDISTAVRLFAPGIVELQAEIPHLLSGRELERLQRLSKEYEEQNVPAELAMQIAVIGPMSSALDIIEAATNNQWTVQQVAKVYFELGDKLELAWFRELISDHPVDNNWNALARAACKDDLDRQQRSITEGVLRMQDNGMTVEACIDAWLLEHKVLVDRWLYLLAELKGTVSRDFSMFAVALRELLDLAQASELAIAAKPPLLLPESKEKRSKTKVAAVVPNTPAKE